MYELYDREFDIDETFEVINVLQDLRRINQTRNRMILKHGEDSEQANRYLELEHESYKDCKDVFLKYKLEYKPYKLI